MCSHSTPGLLVAINRFTDMNATIYPTCTCAHIILWNTSMQLCPTKCQARTVTVCDITACALFLISSLPLSISILSWSYATKQVAGRIFGEDGRVCLSLRAKQSNLKRFSHSIKGAYVCVYTCPNTQLNQQTRS